MSKVQPVKPASAAHLHPSWSAKQKQKEAAAMAAPFGSKVVFEDDGQAVRSKAPPPGPTTEVAPVKHSEKAAEADTLHPSWVAKKAAASKQIQLAQSAKASKITFD